MTQFKFNDNVRPIVANLANMLQWANNQDHDDYNGRPVYASQRGLFGHFYNAVKTIITEECGSDVYNAIERSRDGYNFGGNATYLDDIECAIDNAYADLNDGFERLCRS
jgi:hypothetical protein